MRVSHRAWPLLVLLAEVLAFFRHILFYGHYAIPWDFRYYHFSLASFVARSFERGELPLWDPYTYCGMPIYADLTTQLFYPPTLAAVLLSNWTGGGHLLYWLELQLVAHVFLGGALTYGLLRHLRVGRAAALAAATVYQLGGYMASQTQHLGAIDAAAWLPLVWLSVMALASRFQWRWLGALAFALAMSILAGFPATSAVVLISGFLLALILVALRQASWRLPAYVAAGAVWAVLLSAIQILPTLELSRLSVAQYRSKYLGTGGGMPLASLVSLVSPNHYGIFQFDGGTWKLPWDPTFLYAYCGIPALLFAALALVFRKNRYAAAFGLLTGCAALWMLGDSTPVGRTLFVLLPDALKGSLYAQFALCAFSLGVSVLAGLGAEQFLHSRAPWVAAAAVAVMATDLIAVSSARPFNTADERVDPGIAYNHFDHWPEIPAEIRRLVNQNTPPWRVDSIHNGYVDLVTHGPLFEYPSANGNDPFALIRLMQARLSFSKGELWGRYYEVKDPDSPVLKLMNVRYLIAGGDLANRGSLALVTKLPGTWIYENPGALSRFFLVNRIRRADDMDTALRVLRSPDFDVHSEAVVEGPVPFDTAAAGNGAVRVVDYGARELVLDVDTTAPALLVTSESSYPGWHAWVDGRPHELLTTNVAFRGLTVPAGKHEVKMRFDPAILWRSALLTLISALALMMTLVWPLVSR